MAREKTKEDSEMFKKGVAVEVSSEDEGLRGSWYTATVIRNQTQTHNKILVEYHNLVADEQGSKKLQELVDPILIRPIPPCSQGPNPPVYRVMDDVDAFHHDGWWEGVVTRVLVDNRNSPKYSVFFRCSREQIDFSTNDLRLHREWLGGNRWNPSPSPSPSTRTRAAPSSGGRTSRR
ncbi:protein AGENET DOMAIN (AGD)-CONTAINING P1-like [Silene latifolia]|uniref:protein AGENET DOMAIN (AGD)-CONTAINING P1-like n=1 Tax=Silene latifolia TaxID=37657 RepID=UPI003D76DEB7